jgi:hypothetical protein
MFRTILFLTSLSAAFADLVPLKWPLPTRKLPPAGVEVKEAERSPLLAELKSLQAAAAAQREHLYFPDVEIYLDAVSYALENNEVYSPKELALVKQHLATARKRLAALGTSPGKPAWVTQVGLTVRGFRSVLDGSAQPYGVEIPENYSFAAAPGPLYVWLHGRGDKNTNLTYIAGCEKKKGQFPPQGQTMAIHPFGRHCVGFKSAGEVDVLEAIAAAQREYPVSPDKVAIMGFSMGGAGAWHLGAHYNERWAVVHTGAGFVDVRRYQNLTPEKMPPAYEQQLWGVYDVPDYARRLLNRPLISYSGAEDKQKASADIMEAELAKHGHKLTHIVGAKMGHKYDAASIAIIQPQIDAALAKGRPSDISAVHFQTKTLRYPQQDWVLVTGLARHWEDSRVDAERQGKGISATTLGVTELEWKVKAERITLDGQAFTAGTVFHKADGKWAPGPRAAGLWKRPGLQGPMDDALLEPFLLVEPTGKAASQAVADWTAFEIVRFKRFWHDLFRGKVRSKPDTGVTPEDAAKYHLIVFGDPSSNKYLAKQLSSGKLPVTWTADAISLGKQAVPAGSHVPAWIYPNPANPAKYLVVNNGCSFREGHCSTNSLQNPKLPDWAIFDITTPPNEFAAGTVKAAGFFDEQWR